MAADGAIRESELFVEDGSIDRIIHRLDNLVNTLSGVSETIKSTAKSAISDLKEASAATLSGKEQIDRAATSATRLAKAVREVGFAQSEAGKTATVLKNLTSQLNKETLKQAQFVAAAEGSYNKLELELKEYVELWKSLTPAERAARDMGGEIIATIKTLRSQLAGINKDLETNIRKATEVELAEKKLNFLRSEEGQRLLEIRKQINEIVRGRSQEKEAIDRVAEATKKLAYIQSDEYAKIQQLNEETRKQQKIVQLTTKINNSAVGSYDQLAAQYALNKIRLNAMSHEERNAADSGKQLEAETHAIYKQMIRLQEATGNYRLSVGNYKLAWNGLGNAMNQVIRELPAATMGVNTFFLAISNNIPVLIDEIDKVRKRNKLLQAEGKATTSVVKTITGAIFSWQTALILCLTALSMHGKEILDWIGKMFKGRDAAISFKEILKNVNKELEKTNGSYGENIVSLKRLSNEWKNLTSQKDKLQFIKDNKTEFDKLDISIRNVNDAENALVNNTDAMTEALRLRAKAAAAMKLAADKYEEALKKQLEAEQEEFSFEREVDAKTGKVTIKKTRKAAPRTYQQTGIVPGTIGYNVFSGQSRGYSPEENWSSYIKRKYDEAKAVETEADAYFELSDALNQSAYARLKEAGIERAHKYGRTHTEREKHLRDLTDTIWKNDLSIRKKYELSISALQRDEFQKRKIEAIDATNATIREMQEKYRKNQDFLENRDNRYKPLTPEQRKQIEEQQNEINAIIENSRRKLEIDLQQIEDERQIDSLKKLREMMKNRLSIITQDLEKEKQLRLEQLDNLEAMYATKARTSSGGEIEVTAQRRTPEQIAEFYRKRQQITAEYNAIIYRMRERSIENEIELVKKGTAEEIDLLLQRNEIARQLALAENMLKPASERQDESQINAIYDKRRLHIYGSQKMTNFEQLQKQAEAEFNIVKRSERQITIFKLQQERDRWKKQIELAKQGAIDWSDAQMKEAEAMIKKLDREISEAENPFNIIAEKGLQGGLLTMLGFDDDQIAAFTDAVNIILDNLRAIADAEVQLAEIQVQKAQERVSAAKEAYDAEVEARNNGYANSVIQAKKELEQERKNQRQKERLLEQAKRRQEAINTVVQASSLVTASANLWAAFSSIPITGPALALAAIAAMWASFTAAKIRAAQVTREQSYEYGEGGLEILNGGSHASGNDIDLHTKNSKGQNMRAEGGEALAIINKRNTKKYKKLLPDVVDSLNSGLFEEKYINAFKSGENLQTVLVTNNFSKNVDLSNIEQKLEAIKNMNKMQIIMLPDGRYMIKQGNNTRYVN